MAHKGFPRKEIRRTKNIPPIVSISRMGLVLNRAAIDLVGKDKSFVVLSFDEEANPQEIGLWFWRDKQKAGQDEEMGYAVTHYKEGHAKISSRLFVEVNDLVKTVRTLGKKSFLIFLKKDPPTAEGIEGTGAEFYVVKLT